MIRRSRAKNHNRRKSIRVEASNAVFLSKIYFTNLYTRTKVNKSNIAVKIAGIIGLKL